MSGEPTELSCVSDDLPLGLTCCMPMNSFRMSPSILNCLMTRYFPENHHNIQPTTYPWNWDMGCLLWIQALINVIIKSLFKLLWCYMQYHVLPGCVIMRYNEIGKPTALNISKTATTFPIANSKSSFRMTKWQTSQHLLCNPTMFRFYYFVKKMHWQKVLRRPSD